MFKKIFKSLVTMESICSLIGLINTFFGFTRIFDLDILIRIVMGTTGIILIIYIFYSSAQSQKVSNFITNNEVIYKKQLRSAFTDLEDKKRWMFYALSDKFPSLSCRKLKKLITKHYEFIGDKQ